MVEADASRGKELGSDYARKFELLLNMFPHPDRRDLEDLDKRKWKGSELSRATDGRLSGGYITGLRSGRIKRPGPEHLDLIANALGFPFELWLADPSQWPAILARTHKASRRPASEGPETAGALAARVGRLFDSIPDRATGRGYTYEEVAELSGGRLSTADVLALRDGSLPNPTRAQLLALCDVFDVDFSYWGEQRDEQPLLDRRVIEALRSDTRHLILHKSLGLNRQKMDMVLLLMEQLENLEPDREGASAVDERGDRES